MRSRERVLYLWIELKRNDTTTNERRLQVGTPNKSQPGTYHKQAYSFYSFLWVNIPTDHFRSFSVRVYATVWLFLTSVSKWTGTRIPLPVYLYTLGFRFGSSCTRPIPTVHSERGSRLIGIEKLFFCNCFHYLRQVKLKKTLYMSLKDILKI